MAAEIEIKLHGISLVSAPEDFVTVFLGDFLIEDVAGLLEGLEGVAFEHLGPEIAVIAHVIPM